MTDGEDAFVSAIATFFPNMQRYLDWGHIFKNAKRALARSNITNREEVARYMGDLRTLFYKSTELNYHKQYNKILSGHRWMQVSGFVVSFSYVILIHLKQFQFIFHLCFFIYCRSSRNTIRKKSIQRLAILVDGGSNCMDFQLEIPMHQNHSTVY